MEATLSYYSYKLKETLEKKQRLNSTYSLRAYARDLGMHPSTLNQILKGTRPLPFKDCANVLSKLNLSAEERTRFMESLLKKKTKLDKIEIKEIDERFMLDESHYKIIAEWEHYVVLDLFDVKDFTPTLEEISKRLKITEERAQVVLNNLFTAGLIARDESGKITKIHENVRTTEDISCRALKDANVEVLALSLKKLEEIEVELRDYSSTTVAIDLNKLPEAKTIIREFRQKMTALLRDGEKTDVYQLAIQFYPLTEIQKQN